MTPRIRDFCIAARMLGWLLVVRLLKRLLPLPRLVRLMCSHRPGRHAASAAEIERTSDIARALASRIWPGASGSCLEQSLVVYRYLSARSARPELVIGVRRIDEAVGAHAWVTIDGRPVGQSPAALAAFTPVVTFGSGGRPASPACP